MAAGELDSLTYETPHVHTSQAALRTERKARALGPVRLVRHVEHSCSADRVVK